MVALFVWRVETYHRLRARAQLPLVEMGWLRHGAGAVEGLPDDRLRPRATDPPDCDVLFIIKERPAASFIAKAKDRGARIVYCPIDFYENREQLDRDADFFRACDMVLLHCERHLPLVQHHCPRTHFVEHHARFSLPEMADFKKDGFVLWIGACEYLAHFVSWLELHPIRNEVKLLTNLDRAWATRAARRYFTLSLGRGAKTLAGCEIHQWSERKQLEMMRECKAAIDVKQLEIFNQYYKPRPMPPSPMRAVTS